VTRRLSDDEAAAALARAEPLPADVRPRQLSRSTIEGVAPSGLGAMVHLTGATLVVFASTTCEGCKDLADLVREGVDGFSVVGALRAPKEGLPDGEVGAFVGDRGVWLLGDDAFSAFDVRSAPFFCILDSDGELVVEGVALGRAHVEGHCADVASGTPRPDAIRLSLDPS
jgi:hypothetical protein